MDAKLQSIERFNIKKALNGYTIDVEFKAVTEPGRYSSTEYTTLVARDLDEVRGLMGEWFGKLGS